MSIVWAYGVTTVPERRKTTLPLTLRSLHRAGFSYPRLFIDGAPPRQQSIWAELGSSVSFRWPRMGAMGNWFLSLWELYMRNPKADRYAVFQDDFVCVRGLRSYIDLWFPPRGYLNLYTVPINQMKVTEPHSAPVGWFPAHQNGYGAVGLVFCREGVEAVLTSQFMFRKHQDSNRGHKNIDGAVIQVMKKGQDPAPPFVEYCHSPSLLQHIGSESTLDHKVSTDKRFGTAVCFPGENASALSFLTQCGKPFVVE